MKRGLALLGVALLAACGDVCEGQASVCIALTVRGSVDIDQLHARIEPDGADTSSARLDAPIALPFTVAVIAPDRSGTAMLLVEGLRGGAVVGASAISLTLVAGHNAAAELELGVPQADAASPPDESAPPDLSSDVHRAFLAGPYQGSLIQSELPDDKCKNAKDVAMLSGTFLSMLQTGARPNLVAAAGLGPNHTVVNAFDGSIVADHGSFWTSSHQGPLKALAGSVPKGTYMWTGFDANGQALLDNCASGVDQMHPCTCMQWASPNAGDAGAIGDPNALDGTWAKLSAQSCDNSDYLLCLEQ